MRRKTKQKWVTLIVTLSLLFLTTSEAYGMGVLQQITRYLIKDHKQNTKRVDRANQYEQKIRMKEVELQIKREENKFNQQFRQEVTNKLDKPPLQRTYIQKIEVYEQELTKVKSPKDLDKIINHIRRYGVEKYGDNLSQKHKDLLKKLEDIKKNYDDEDDKNKDGNKGGGLIVTNNIKDKKTKKNNPLATTGGIATGGAILYVAFRIIKAFTPLRFIPF